MKRLLKAALTALLLAGLIFTGCNPETTPEEPENNTEQTGGNEANNTENTDSGSNSKDENSSSDDKTNSTDKNQNTDKDKTDSTNKDDKNQTPDQDKNADNSNNNENQQPSDENNNGADNSDKGNTGDENQNESSDNGGSDSNNGTDHGNNGEGNDDGSQNGNNGDGSDNSGNNNNNGGSDSGISSVNFAKNLTIGWNLGNAFDANSAYLSGKPYSDYAYNEGVNLEYNWLPHKEDSKTTQNLIKAVSNAGFKTIRIPVSWHNHMGGLNPSSYTIDSAWMNRVKTVVDWAIAEDMYVIINLHHDNLTEAEMDAGNPGFVLSTNNTYKEKSKNYIEQVWTQISNTFKNYDEHLIFEILNEPRCIGTNYEWFVSGPSATTYCNVITEYEQAALNIIRNSGGNNANRFVMVPSYAAAPEMLQYYKMPTDTATDKLLISAHAYTPGAFALKGEKTNYTLNRTSIENDINTVFNTLNNSYVAKGIGVVIGEASSSDKENLPSRLNWTNYYFAKAKEIGIPVVLWDNEVVVSELSTDEKAKFDAGDNGENHGYFNRKTCEQYFPTLIEAMMNPSYSNITDSSPSGSGKNAIYTINYSAKDGEAIFKVENNWKALTVEFVELVEGMQFVAKSNLLKEDHGYWEEYYCEYIPVNSTVTTIDINSVLTKIKNANSEVANDITSIASISIQNTKDSSNSYKVAESKVTMNDNSTTDNVKPGSDGWCSSIVENQ